MLRALNTALLALAFTALALIGAHSLSGTISSQEDGVQNLTAQFRLGALAEPGWTPSAVDFSTFTSRFVTPCLNEPLAPESSRGFAAVRLAQNTGSVSAQVFVADLPEQQTMDALTSVREDIVNNCPQAAFVGRISEAQPFSTDGIPGDASVGVLVQKRVGAESDHGTAILTIRNGAYLIQVQSEGSLNDPSTIANARKFAAETVALTTSSPGDASSEPPVPLAAAKRSKWQRLAQRTHSATTSIVTVGNRTSEAAGLSVAAAVIIVSVAIRISIGTRRRAIEPASGAEPRAPGGLADQIELPPAVREAPPASEAGRQLNAEPILPFPTLTIAEKVEILHSRAQTAEPQMQLQGFSRVPKVDWSAKITAELPAEVAEEQSATPALPRLKQISPRQADVTEPGA